VVKEEGPVPRTDADFHFTQEDLPGILAAATVFLVVNSSLVATVIALVQGLRVGRSSSRTPCSRSRPAA